jgi:hypothetical protein
MSVLYVGAYALSHSRDFGSSSIVGGTTVSNISVIISSAAGANCSAVTTSSNSSLGATSYGGSLSLLYVGAYAWSYSEKAGSNSTSEATSISRVIISVHNAACANCSAVTTSGEDSYGASSYGGSMSVLYVGAYAWSYSVATNSNSASDATYVSVVNVSISSAACTNCSAVSFSGNQSHGANSYGGSIAFFIGAFCFSFSNGGIDYFSYSASNMTLVYNFLFSMMTSDFRLSRALSRTLSCFLFGFFEISLTVMNNSGAANRAEDENVCCQLF